MSKRSLKIGGNTTSLFLEDAFWQEIQLRAEIRGMSHAEFLRELLASFEQHENRSAAIKEYLILELRKEYSALQRKKEVALKSKWLLEFNGIRSRHEFKQAVITIGHSSNRDLQLKEGGIANRQAMLSHDGTSWWLVNLAPGMPITVDGKQLDVARVVRNSEVDIGNYQIIKG